MKAKKNAKVSSASGAQKKIEAEKQKYFESVFNSRGFRFGLHEVQATADWEFSKKHEDWMKFIYTSDRFLDRRCKELVLTGILCALRAPAPHIQAHMKRAVEDGGATAEEVIEVVELAGHWGGSVARTSGQEAWRLQFAPHLPGIFEPAGPGKSRP